MLLLKSRKAFYFKKIFQKVLTNNPVYSIIQTVKGKEIKKMTVKEFLAKINELLETGKINENAEVINMQIDDWGDNPVEWIGYDKKANILEID